MDYYYHEFEELEKEFHEVMHDYPLFKEDIDRIYDVEIKEINEWLEKNDEFYLKKVNRKLKDLIEYIKNTSTSIDEEYQKFDKLASLWEKSTITSMDEKELDLLNEQINEANKLIKSHELKDIKEANKIMENVLKKAK